MNLLPVGSRRGRRAMPVTLPASGFYGFCDARHVKRLPMGPFQLPWISSLADRRAPKTLRERSIPIAAAAVPRGSAQSGFYEAAGHARTTLIAYDLTETSRFPFGANTDSRCVLEEASMHDASLFDGFTRACCECGFVWVYGAGSRFPVSRHNGRQVVSIGSQTGPRIGVQKGPPDGILLFGPSGARSFRSLIATADASKKSLSGRACLKEPVSLFGLNGRFFAPACLPEGAARRGCQDGRQAPRSGLVLIAPSTVPCLRRTGHSQFRCLVSFLLSHTGVMVLSGVSKSCRNMAAGAGTAMSRTRSPLRGASNEGSAVT